jgi:transposase
MAQNFLSCDREQDFLLPPSVREWLPAGHLAWYLLEVVARFDLDGFYGEYRADGSGRPAHDPAMMVALLLYAYAVGERSSRRIERRCVEDVAFRVIAANRAPDHTTISRFRQRHAERLAELFVQVLALCARAGMVRVGTVAVDGTKLAANAGLSANRGYAKIREEVEQILAEADAVDAAEDERFGDARGDELPEELADPVTRRERLERAQRELEAEHAARVAEHEAMLARRAAEAERTGGKPRGRPPGAGPGPEPAADAKRNITDPDSRIMRSRGAPVQAYNGQAVVGEGRVILAADVTTSPNDSHQLLPMLQATRENLQAIGHDETIRCVLADGGYWNHEHIATAGQSAVVVIPTSDPHHTQRKQRPRQGPEAGWV